MASWAGTGFFGAGVFLVLVLVFVLEPPSELVVLLSEHADLLLQVLDSPIGSF